MLNVLVIDSAGKDRMPKQEGINYYTLDDLGNEQLVGAVLKKYSKPDHIRWCFKPLLLMHLLENNERVIYLDNDLFFYNSYDFLFDYLKTDYVLLSPHWRIIDPEKEQHWLITNFREGIYNAGFLGVRKEAKQVLEWWAKACIYKCVRNYYYALFDDQKYLDIFPVLEPHTRILNHKGCNVAGWNIQNCPRIKTNGQITIDSKWPIVFIHFANYTFYQIKLGKDPLLQELFDQYVKTLVHFNPRYNLQSEIKKPSNRAWFRYFRWRFYELLNK